MTVPAQSSSGMDPALAELVTLSDEVSRQVGRRIGDDCRDAQGAMTVLGVLDQILDPRQRRGRRHSLVSILGVAVCAVLAGARSYVAIAEWVADADVVTLALLGVRVSPPTESTIRRTVQALDGDDVDARLGAWAQARTTPAPTRRRRIAVDGKAVRGSGSAGATVRGPGRHLLAAFDHDHGVVLAQVDVGDKTNEIPLFSVLLDGIDLAAAVVTADAMHAQRGHAEYLHDRGAHYLLTVKRNQPTLHARLAALPWTKVPIAHDTRETGHGRREWRTLKVTAVSSGLGFPHAAQAIRLTRRRRHPATTAWSTETVYAITSLTTIDATPTDLADIARGHWGIEDRLHWVRDVTFDEDRSQIRTRNGPRLMATLRNLAINILRLTGTTNIAAALRHHARRPDRPLRTIMTC